MQDGLDHGHELACVVSVDRKAAGLTRVVRGTIGCIGQVLEEWLRRRGRFPVALTRRRRGAQLNTIDSNSLGAGEPGDPLGAVLGLADDGGASGAAHSV